MDFRKANNKTIKEAYPLPRFDDTINTLVGAEYFSKLDLRSVYWQVQLAENDKQKTGFFSGSIRVL